MADRASQLPAEAVVLATSGLARASQLPAEAVVLPDTTLTRLSQVVVEALVKVGSPSFPRGYW